ncbi:MAG: (2Fe-2S) ferredoxin domain-containing protein [Candidatus Omnitrophica bacterium]|nr:(2Fe-2S) ferredoxin domain-containing protein [Candidatus Omnitrophota bacterium]
MKKLSREDLDKRAQARKEKTKDWIKVGMSTCGIAAGAQEVFAVLAEEVKKRNIPVEVKKCGCVGMCYAEPLVEVNVEGLPAVIYGKVNKDAAIKILEKHVCGKMLVNDYIFDMEEMIK